MITKIKNFRYKRLFASSIFWKILTVNLIAPLALFVGIINFDSYQKGLIDSQFEYMKSHANLISTTIAESGVEKSYVKNDRSITGKSITYWIRTSTTKRILEKTVNSNSIRYRVFNNSGKKIADTGKLLEIDKKQGIIYKEERLDFITKLTNLYNKFLADKIDYRKIEKYQEKENETIKDYGEAVQSLKYKKTVSMVRYQDGDDKILTVATPIRYYNKSVGVVLASLDAKLVAETLADVRNTIFKIFAVAFVLTIILSLYLFYSIAIPLIKLSDAAKNIKSSKTKEYFELNKLVKRRDEIGRMSISFKSMVNSLWRKLNTMEKFAADVSHELKNPLTSIKSAVETYPIVKSEEKKLQLFEIVKNDIDRADKIITDIANLSKVEAEMSRERMEKICLYDCLKSIVHTYRAIKNDKGLTFKIRATGDKTKISNIFANKLKVIQVFDNIIANAVSFSPDNGEININLSRRGKYITVNIVDEGKGIKKGEEKKIFDRFYSDRIDDDWSMTDSHSGLGLSIVKKIVRSMDGEVKASNDSKKGAKFTIRLKVIELED